MVVKESKISSHGRGRYKVGAYLYRRAKSHPRLRECPQVNRLFLEEHK